MDVKYRKLAAQNQNVKFFEVRVCLDPRGCSVSALWPVCSCSLGSFFFILSFQDVAHNAARYVGRKYKDRFISVLIPKRSL